MKSTLSTLALAVSLVSPSLAFPSAFTNAIGNTGVSTNEVRDVPTLLKRRTEDRLRKRAFDASAQHIETSGDHKWTAPNFAAGDQRGPCPGLNALANHGYLPRTGVTPLTTILSATNQVYGMGADLSAFLAAFGTLFDGNILSLDPGYSIGGPDPRVQNLGDLTGSPTGLSGSHNKYEADSSPTRGDLYMYGNDYKVQVHQFQQYYDALVENIPAPQQYDRLFNFRQARFNDSLHNNPYFFFSPFAGVLVAPAGYNFPPAMMANHSAEFPEGMLSKENLMSFFSITGKSGNFKYTEGHERIPDNWYRRAFGDEYTIPAFLADVVDFIERDPRLAMVGGNTGKGNSYFSVDIANLTGGVFGAETLLKGNNLECFTFQAAEAALPDFLGGGSIENPKSASGLVGKQIGSALANLACPKLHKYETQQYKRFPGYRKSGGAI